MSAHDTFPRRLPPVLSILPTRAEIESMAAWGRDQPGSRTDQATVPRPRDVDAEIRRAIAESQARRASGKKPKTYTLDQVRKMRGLPPL